MADEILCKGGRPEILPELEIDGDVDSKTGNIDFPGSVSIPGSVREGFQVRAGRDVEIMETVEGGTVESKADITINGGVRGAGKGSIVAAGDVKAKFLDQAYVRCKGNIKIDGPVLNSDVGAQMTVEITGRESRIVGGKIQAGADVVCENLGSEAGEHTEIAVGVPPEHSERRNELRNLIAELSDNLTTMETDLEFLKKKHREGSMDERQRISMLSMVRGIFELRHILRTRQSELKKLEQSLNLGEPRSVVKVNGLCHPGVIVTIGDYKYAVGERLDHLTFVYDAEARAIALRPFDKTQSGD